MTLETPVFLEAVSGDAAITFSARQIRTIMDAIWSGEGAVGLNDLVVSQRGAGANMSVDVSTGLCVIQGDSVTAQGKYVCRSTAVVNVPIAAAPTSGTRTDIIVAQLLDKQADGGSQYAWQIVSVTGSTTPPASSAQLATITVGTNVTSIVTSAISATNRQQAVLSQIDTGWISLTISTGSGTLQYRVKNGYVTARGTLTGLTLLSNGTTTTVANAGAIPAIYRPGVVGVYGTANMGGSLNGIAIVGTDGSIGLQNSTGSTTNVARFYFSYPVE